MIIREISDFNLESGRYGPKSESPGLSWRVDSSDEIGDVQFYCKLKYANLVEWKSILTHCLIARRGPDLFVYASSSVAFFLMQWEKSTVIFPMHFICVWLRTCSTIFSWLEHIRNSLICCRIQQKIHETHKICLWLEHIRSSHKKFAFQL